MKLIKLKLKKAKTIRKEWAFNPKTRIKPNKKQKLLNRDKYDKWYDNE